MIVAADQRDGSVADLQRAEIAQRAASQSDRCFVPPLADVLEHAVAEAQGEQAVADVEPGPQVGEDQIPDGCQHRRRALDDLPDGQVAPARDVHVPEATDDGRDVDPERRPDIDVLAGIEAGSEHAPDGGGRRVRAAADRTVKIAMHLDRRPQRRAHLGRDRSPRREVDGREAGADGAPAAFGTLDVTEGPDGPK